MERTESELTLNPNLTNRRAACRNGPIRFREKLSTSYQNNMAGMYYDLFIVNFKMLYIREKGRHILLKWLFLTPEGNIQL